MNFAAIGTPPQDLAAGLDFLGQQCQEFNLPCLSANLQDKTDKRPFRPSIMTKIGETTVAIIGLTGGPATNPPDKPTGEYRLLPWQEALPDTLKQVTFYSDC